MLPEGETQRPHRKHERADPDSSHIIAAYKLKSPGMVSQYYIKNMYMYKTLTFIFDPKFILCNRELSICAPMPGGCIAVEALLCLFVDL